MEIARNQSFSVTGGTTAIEKGFNEAGRGPAPPLLRPVSIWAPSADSKIQSTVDLHGKQEHSSLPQQLFYTAMFQILK